MIIIEQTACATWIRSLTEIKQHRNNGMDYFGITAETGGVGGCMILRDGQYCKYKLHRNHNKVGFLVLKQKIIASSEQDNEATLIHMSWLKKPGF